MATDIPGVLRLMDRHIKKFDVIVNKGRVEHHRWKEGQVDRDPMLDPGYGFRCFVEPMLKQSLRCCEGAVFENFIARTPARRALGRKHRLGVLYEEV